MTIERREQPVDLERRSLWLALAVGLIVIFRSASPGFVYFGRGRDLQLWLSVASLIAFGLSLCLCLLLVVPELRARVGQRFRDRGLVFSWSFGLFILGMVITIAAAVEAAIDLLDEDTPFG